MIHYIIWSKDRAAQLACLIDSMYAYLINDLTPKKISVIYKTSNEKFEQAYKKVKSIYRDINLIKEKDFYFDSLDIINKTEEKYLCFLTDDTVFFAYGSEFPTELMNEKTVFSLRLGINTRIQDHINQTIQPELECNSFKNFLYWNPKKYSNQYNYGYPFAIDAHIYEKEMMQKIINNIYFKNTNDLEGKLQNYNYLIENIISYEHSIAVNIPCNNISGLTEINKTNSYSMELLNNKFLSDYILKLEVGQKIVGCHQDLRLTHELNKSKI